MATPSSPDALTPSQTQGEEQSFFKAWSIRQPHHSGSSESSPATTPASPGTIPTKRRTSRPVWGRAQSEIALSPLKQYDTIKPSSTFRPMILAANVEVPQKVKDKFRSEQASSRRDVSSSSSSASGQLQLIGGRPRRPGRPVSESSEKKPERKGRTGYRWKREFSSHRIEIRIRRTSRSSSKAKKASEDSTPAPASTNVREPILENKVVSNADVPSSAIQDSSVGEPSAQPNAEGVPPKSLYSRAKRLLGLKTGTVVAASRQLARRRTWSKTGPLLERVATSLQDTVAESSQPSKRKTSQSNASIAAAPASPSHGGGGFFKRSRQSVSSSIRSLFMGKPPKNSPDQAAMYTSSDRQQYFRVEMTGPDAPTFLPSEARRVGTPPLSSRESGKGRLRGFFFDLRSPNQENTESPRWELPEEKRRVSATSTLGPEIEWFRVRVTGPEQAGAINEFEFNLPEHLPTSPLCPKNPKHSSGGSGICVYHGRNHSLGSLGEEEEE